MIDETAKIAPNSPWYLPRSRGLKRSPMTASAMGKMAPAPRPWMPRNRMSCHISCERAHSSDPMRKRLTPIMIIGRRPNWSDSLP